MTEPPLLTNLPSVCASIPSDDRADIVIIPGSKNTISDMKWLLESGMAPAIQRFAENGPVVGICGGFQMLGAVISDPEAVESDSESSIRGLGLLQMETVMEAAKHRSQTEGVFEDMTGVFSSLSGEKFSGYEIHNGYSVVNGKSVTIVQTGNIFGTYVHGIFDNGDIALRLVQALAHKKGLELSTESMDYASMKEKEYDKLADIVRANLDMKYIYEIISLPPLGEGAPKGRMRV